MKEVEAGMATHPISYTLADKIYGYASHRLSPRFIVHQESKDRPCDNCKISKLNRTYYSPEKLVLLRADFNAIVGKRFYDIAKRDNWLDSLIMGSGGDDEPDAYRNVPQDDTKMTLVTLVDPTDGIAKVTRVRGHLFGLAPAVMNFSRRSTALSALTRRFLAALIAAYLDDYCSSEPKFALGPLDPNGADGFRFPFSSQGALWFFSQNSSGGASTNMRRGRKWPLTPGSSRITLNYNHQGESCCESKRRLNSRSSASSSPLSPTIRSHPTPQEVSMGKSAGFYP